MQAQGNSTCGVTSYHLWFCEESRWYSYRAVFFPQRGYGHARAFPSCPYFQVHSLLMVHEILSKGLSIGKNILYSALPTVHSKFTKFSYRIPQYCKLFNFHSLLILQAIHHLKFITIPINIFRIRTMYSHRSPGYIQVSKILQTILC